MIQIRNVPEALHRRLKVRAATEGLSLSDMLLREIEQFAKRPTTEELRARLAVLPAFPEDFDSVAAVRAERDGR